ncbi:translation initiation factor IF-2 [Entomortierella parvispora]|uniref:Translation initiation factor IF-2, mitochondrial n=1 Tax=Entomortierella parvispora TaxID=205924 RepID=A0A9P3HCP7_9FUNG|nr:translation initiation factor IF-2 [Entomortierella parvispora]
MWKVSAINSRSCAAPSRLCPRLLVSTSSHGRVLLTSGRRTFQTGTRRNLDSGNPIGGNGGSSSGRVPLVGDRITLDPKTKQRMELRKDISGGKIGNSNATGSNAGSNKWATPPGQAARTQNSQYRRAFEESRDNQYGYSSGSRGQSNAGKNQQQSGEGARRPGRYVDQRNNNASAGSRGQQQQQPRSNAPSSFATSASWGFSAPKPKAQQAPPQAPPSSFATSASRGFSAPAPKPKPAAQGSAPAQKPASAPTTTSPQKAVSDIGKEAAAPATKTPAPVTAKTAPATSSAGPPATKPATTFTKSSRTAKENARIEVARRSQNRRQKQKAAKDVFIPEAVSVSNLAGLLGARIGHFEKTMKALGMEITRHDHILTSEDASLLALEYNVNPILANTEALFDLTPQPEPEDMSIYPLRPPVVTIMGHVDHGKTTLLDSLRKTSVAAGEAGGITQHIGAFSVLLPSKQRITFLDTPGHAAFSAMRARGAQTTDIVVLVVAAEDGVMPQTAEAIKHAEEAGVPIIVAINKCDKYGAEPDKAKQALLKYGVTVEDLGGETQCIEVSGLTGKNLDKLEEAILTLAEVLDLRAETSIRGEGHIIESQVEKGRGNVATVLVKRGTLKVGDTIVAGSAWCKVKALVNDTGKNVKDAPPGTPVKVMGWKDLPMAGDEMLGAESEEQAKLVMTNRALKKERKEQLKTLVAINEKRRITAEEEDEEKMALKEYKRKAWLFHQGVIDTYPEPIQVKKQLSVAAMQAKEEEASEVKNMRMVVKGDVSGTVEAVCDALSGLPANQVKVSVIQSGVGNITESDIQFAASCNAMVLGFNVKADKKLMQTARQMGVGLKSYNVIYKLLDDVKVEMATLLPKDIEIQVVGEAKVAQVFPIKMKGGQTQNVAGCRIVNGGVTRKEDVRIVRDGEVIWDGRLSTLKRIKEDIQEAKKGTECGMEFEGFQDFKEGDVIQSIKKIEVLRKL